MVSNSETTFPWVTRVKQTSTGIVDNESQVSQCQRKKREINNLVFFT